MKLTNFTFYKNTPFVNFNNTILFTSNAKRDEYFNSNFSKVIEYKAMFNFIRDRSTIRTSIPYEDFAGVNYCRFVSDFEKGKTFYAYVMGYSYINDNTTEVQLLIDVVMTYCQGNVINNFRNLSVTRKHLPRSEYNERLSEIKGNDDILKAVTKRYTNTNKVIFKDLSVIIQCSVDLEAEFGTVDDPKIESSVGLTFDKISSPVNLYVVTKSNFNSLMKKLKKFPWITQNFRSVSLVPTVLLEGNTEKCSPTSFEFSDLYTLKNGGSTKINTFDDELLKISMSLDKMFTMFGLDPKEDQHLLRNEYTTTEVYTFNGSQLFIDNGLLSDKYGLFFKSSFIMGYHNEVAIYVDNYKSDNDKEGSFLNDAIYISNFDDVPIMVDNYNLSLSKSANQRQLAESKLVTNKIGNVLDNDASIKDRFFDGASLISNLSPTNLFGKFSDERDFYRQQQAEFKDMALNSDSVTAQSNNNSLAIARDFFGITVKHAHPIPSEWDKIKRYYKSFGYLLNDENSKVNVRSMTICDYVQFTGSFMIPNIDIALNNMLKALFESGIRFWHDNGTENPMTQDVLNNKMR